MAGQFYVAIEAAKQGRLKGESERPQHADKMSGIAFSYEVKSLRDAATGQASGKRQHGPVTFTKEWGAASPQLFQALVTNELLKDVLFEFVRVDASTGQEVVFETMRLKQANVAEIRRYVAVDTEGELDELELEDIALTFRTIEIENRSGKTLATDTFSERL